MNLIKEDKTFNEPLLREGQPRKEGVGGLTLGGSSAASGQHNAPKTHPVLKCVRCTEMHTTQVPQICRCGLC